MNSCGLQDIGYEGPKYTWSGKRAYGEIIWCRLDRCIATQEWSLLFQNHKLVHKPVTFSNHMALSLQVIGPTLNRKRGLKTFKLEEIWLRSPNCKLIVNTAWQAEVSAQDNHGQHKLLAKIQAVKSKLQQWSRNEFGVIGQKIKSVEIELIQLENMIPNPSIYQEI